MSQRTLLIAALALMGGGLLLGGLGIDFGGGAFPTQSVQVFGPQGQEGPEGGIRPGGPGFGPGMERDEGTWKVVPGRAASPSPKPSPTA